MSGKILVTGSEGLIGSALLGVAGLDAIGLDIRGQPGLRLDVRDLHTRLGDVSDISGIIHLAAVSRVIDAERDPSLCESVNIGGTRTVLEVAVRLPRRPWVIYASSREVYGEQAELPVHEESELKPVNVYARSKLEAERLTERARADGVPACIVRFSSVYGSVHDHADRVVPAFAMAAARGGSMRVDGADGILDFTHVSDVVQGLLKLIDLLDTRRSDLPPPIHFVSGIPTTLGALADLAIELGVDSTSIVPGTPRDFDVHHFYGDPSRASALLGWNATTALRDGFSRLVNDFRAKLRNPIGTGPELNVARSHL